MTMTTAIASRPSAAQIHSIVSDHSWVGDGMWGHVQPREGVTG
jgi:hypothetical protein